MKTYILIEEWSNKFKELLATGLPGESAHLNMAPKAALKIKESFRHDTEPRESAVLILLYLDGDTIKFPLIIRQTYAGVHSGQVSLPGGKLEDSDGDLSITALRETYEEIGVPTHDINLLGRLTTYYVPPSNFNINPYVGYVSSTPDFVIDTYEVNKLINVELVDLFDPKLKKRKMIKTQAGFKIDTPYFDVQGNVVWGATAMILSEFMELVNRMN